MGSLPTTNGKTATAKYGCLIVLDSAGRAVKTIAGGNIQGPWDSTAKSEGSKTTLFVSNALNGGAAKGIHTIDNSTVLRIELESGVNQTPKVLNETVIANGIPWVNSAEALVHGGDGNMVETTLVGQQVAVQTADKKTGAGSLFGLVVPPEGKGRVLRR